MQNAYFCLPREVQKDPKIGEKTVADMSPKSMTLGPKSAPKGSPKGPKRAPELAQNRCLGHVLATLVPESPPGMDFDRFLMDLGCTKNGPRICEGGPLEGKPSAENFEDPPAGTSSRMKADWIKFVCKAFVQGTARLVAKPLG